MTHYTRLRSDPVVAASLQKDCAQCSFDNLKALCMELTNQLVNAK
jgi:hypothetical protein